MGWPGLPVVPLTTSPPHSPSDWELGIYGEWDLSLDSLRTPVLNTEATPGLEFLGKVVGCMLGWWPNEGVSLLTGLLWRRGRGGDRPWDFIVFLWLQSNSSSRPTMYNATYKLQRFKVTVYSQEEQILSTTWRFRSLKYIWNVSTASWYQHNLWAELFMEEKNEYQI